LIPEICLDLLFSERHELIERLRKDSARKAEVAIALMPILIHGITSFDLLHTAAGSTIRYIAAQAAHVKRYEGQLRFRHTFLPLPVSNLKLYYKNE
jgi:hypothetical protein